MTLLVTIPYITTRRDEAIKKRNLRIWIVAIILLRISFIAMVHFLYKPLDLLELVLLRKLNLT